MKTPTKKQYAVIRDIERTSKKRNLDIPLFNGISQTSAYRYISTYLPKISTKREQRNFIPPVLDDDDLPF